tara:strand:+ start:250 stop:528 length:279 start_codon:yes stop_codon:yes gene_type:complete
MPVPSPRNAILPARGDFSVLAANIAELKDGEMCYAIDQDQFYVNEGGTLVAVGAGALATLNDVSLSNVQEGEALIYNDGAWKNGGIMDGGAF